MAHTHRYISHLPDKCDKILGERGTMLSGGQKQRVCIAPALVRNLRLMLQDEFTASLGTASERVVRDALEKASSGRT